MDLVRAFPLQQEHATRHQRLLHQTMQTSAKLAGQVRKDRNHLTKRIGGWHIRSKVESSVRMPTPRRRASCCAFQAMLGHVVAAIFFLRHFPITGPHGTALNSLPSLSTALALTGKDDRTRAVAGHASTNWRQAEQRRGNYFLASGLFFRKNSHSSTAEPSGKRHMANSLPSLSFLNSSFPPLLMQYSDAGLGLATSPEDPEVQPMAKRHEAEMMGQEKNFRMMLFPFEQSLLVN